MRGRAWTDPAGRERAGRRLGKLGPAAGGHLDVAATGCMEGCLAGPALLVVPDTSGTAGSPRLTSPSWSSST